MTADQYAATLGGALKRTAHQVATIDHGHRCERPVRSYAHGSRTHDPARGSFNVKRKRRGRR